MTGKKILASLATVAVLATLSWQLDLGWSAVEPESLQGAVDGTSLTDLSDEDAGALLVGPIGEPRRLSLYRDGETLEVTVASASLPEEQLPQ